MKDHNRARVLAEVLAIDAWHKPLRTDGGTSTVHVEIRLVKGRLGGERGDWPFTFNISLKRALLTVSLEHPLRIDRGSVARPKPISDAERTTILEARDVAKFDAEAKGKISASSFGLSLGSRANGAMERSFSDQVRLVQEIPQTIVTPIPAGPSAYSWELTPGHGEHLSGQPWHPVDEPRLAVKSLPSLPRIDPAIKVSLSCAFDDIEIDDLKPKRDGFLDTIKEVVYPSTNMAAAVQYLKVALKSADLEVGEVDNRFSEILLAEILSMPE